MLSCMSHVGSRIRRLARADLTLHAGAREAGLAWLSVPARRLGNAWPVFALADPETNKTRCFSGFAALCSSDPDPIDVHLLRTPPADDHIRQQAWAEVLDPKGIDTADARRQWLEALKAYLPDDLARDVFGPRGLTLGAAAAHLAVSRRTSERDRRGPGNA